MSIRVHELAKELGITSKELGQRLARHGVEIKSHMSVLTDDQVSKARLGSEKSASVSKAKLPTAAKSTAVDKSTSAEKKVSTAPSTALESVKKQLKISQESVKQPQVPAPAAPKKESSAPLASALAKAAPTKPQSSVESGAPATSLQKSTTSIPKQSNDNRFHKSIAPPSNITSLNKNVDLTTVPKKEQAEPVSLAPKKIELDSSILVKDLAEVLKTKPNEVIQKLIKLKIFANINQSIPFEIAGKVCAEYSVEAVKREILAEDASVKAQAPSQTAKWVSRAPVVTFMGHVDHGKTSLLDAIRKSKVAAGEAGGITQHIGAYQVKFDKGSVTFLDTPGHEAFTAMRARGARATDVVVLVVAADDGVMPQTEEAIDHAQAAGVPIVVAINKMDLPAANPERVKKELMEHGLSPEEWGGKTIMVGVSAKTGKGIDSLLEMLALESDLLELKADPAAKASGVVIEAELSKDKGVLATVLVQNGTLLVGDVVVVGSAYCKVRAMVDDAGQRVQKAMPSMPVEILGLPSVPKAGDTFNVVSDEHEARQIVETKLAKEKQSRSNVSMAHVTLEHLSQDVKAGKVVELKLIIKSDVQGSVEALSATLKKIQAKQVRLNIIHTGIGDISETDVMLAAASDAVIIGFHVGIAGNARDVAEHEQVDIRFYSIIYEAKNAIEKAMEGLLEPERKEVHLGTAEVRQVFKISKKGTIGGCSVVKGKIIRNCHCRVMRSGKRVYEGRIDSLKRFKDDAREVLEGYECGIGVANYDDLLAGDRIEAYEVQELARKLS